MERYSTFIDRKTHIVRMSVLPNLTVDLVLTKMPASYFVGINKLTLKFIWRDKRPRIDNIVLKEKNKVGGLSLPNFKTYYKVVIVKTV